MLRMSPTTTLRTNALLTRLAAPADNVVGKRAWVGSAGPIDFSPTENNSNLSQDAASGAQGPGSGFSHCL